MSPMSAAGDRGVGPGRLPRARVLAGLLRETVSEFFADRALQLGAALAFYTALSLAPTLLLVMSVLGAVYGSEPARDELVRQFGRLIGPQGAELARVILEGVAGEGRGTATLAGAITLAFGATAVLAQLQDAFDTIWEVKAVPGLGVLAWVRKRVLSLLLLLGIAFLLLASLGVDLILAFLLESQRDLPGPDVLWAEGNRLVSLVVAVLIFAALFRYLPDVELGWRHVWLGAAVTGLLFAAGKLVIGLYLGWGRVGSAYGAAGSLLVVLVWVYYSSLIVFFGAEFTRVYTRRLAAPVTPEPHAVAAPWRVRVPVAPAPGAVLAIDHVQLAMPAGREDEARAFYGGLLGLREQPKPEALAARGGVWFAIDGAAGLHLGVDPDFRPARKAHPGLVVRDLGAIASRLRASGVALVDDSVDASGRSRLYLDDPFGNRLELIGGGSVASTV